MKEFLIKQKKLLLLLALSVLVLALALIIHSLPQRIVTKKQAAFGTVEISLQPGSGNYEVGQEFDIQLNIHNPENLKINAYTAVLTFSKDNLEIIRYTPSADFPAFNGTGGVYSPAELGNDDGRAVLEAYNMSQEGVGGESISAGTLRLKGKTSGSQTITINQTESFLTGQNPNPTPTPPGTVDHKIGASVLNGTYVFGSGTTLTPTATAAPPSIFVWRAEAEIGTVTAPMEILPDTSASGARFVSTCNPNNTATPAPCRSVPSGEGELGSAVFNFSVPRAGDYYLWAKAKGRSWSQNSFFVSLDQSPRFRYEIKQHDNQWKWGWEQVVNEDAAVKSNKFTFLLAGSHTLRFGGREGLAGLDTVLLTDSACLIPDSTTTNCDSTITPTLTPTPSGTLTPTQTLTPTLTPTATRTPTPTPTGTITISPTLTPTPTGTITITPSLTPTATPIPGSVVNLAFKVKFQGIATKKADQKVKITVKRDNFSKPLEDITVTASSSGVYSGSVALAGVAPGNYQIYIKGPKHLAKKFCRDNQEDRCTSNETLALIVGENTFDFSKTILEGGDLPNPNDGGKQDGVVNSVDFGLVNNRLGSTAAEDLAIADLDLNGIVNVTDRILLRITLETRYEEDY